MTAFIRMKTTDTTPHALARPNPACPPPAATAAADFDVVAAAAPPDTKSALPITALFGAAATGDENEDGLCCSRGRWSCCWAEDAKAMDTEEDVGLR